MNLIGENTHPYCLLSTRNVVFDPCVEKAKLQITTSGHNWSDTGNGVYNTGNAAEFYEATHNININGATTYSQHLWETCSPNPAGCQPQKRHLDLSSCGMVSWQYGYGVGLQPRRLPECRRCRTAL